jgi:hypothetical protein
VWAQREGAKEGREMTVTIVRPTPGVPTGQNAVNGTRRSLLAALPFDLEVEAATVRKDYAGKCGCSEVYRISQSSVLWLLKHELIRDEIRPAVLAGYGVPVVCRCMFGEAL